MTQSRHPPISGRISTPARLALTAAALLAALLLTRAILPWIPQTQMAVFFGAVAVAATLGGMRYGVGAVVASAVLADLFILSPGTMEVGTLLSSTLVVWSVVALTVSYMVDRMQTARAEAQERRVAAESMSARLEEQSAELELQVSESESMTSELEELNAQLAEQTDRAQRAAVRAERLQALTVLVHQRVGAAGVARHIVEEGRRAVEASAAAVVIMRDDDTLDIIAAQGYPDDVLNPSAKLYNGPTPVVDAIRRAEPIWVPDEAALIAGYPQLADVPKQGAAWAALPLAVDGRKIGALALSFARPGEFMPEDRAFMLLVAQQCAQALERARLQEVELRARVRAEFAERRLAFIAAASERLSASLDYLAALANLAHIVVPEIAEWCLVHLVDDEGVPRLIAATHADPEQAASRRQHEERYPVSREDRAAFAQVLRTGEVVHIEPVTDDYLRSIAHDEQHLSELRQFGIRAQISVPILINDEPHGVVTLANAESGRGFGENDVTLALELGRRAGIAVENARLYQAAHHASETKSDFLAVMSHELRTPLNAIIGYSDLLLMGVPDGVPESAQRQIKRIRIASTSLLHLVEEVLSFSRVEAGKEDIRISPVDITGVVKDCLAMIEPLAAEKSLTLDLAPAEQPIKIVSDERKIRQILTNLLSNAVKFTEAGTVAVVVRDDADYVHIEVRDTGIGISPENLDRIFEAFWQVEQSATRRFGGTGLGLGVARKLAKLLEGRLEVRSTVGEGSVFTLSLPRRTPGMQRLS